MRFSLATVAVAVLAVARTAGAGITPIAASFLTVSPDGTHIAWVDGFTDKIWTARRDGSDAHVLAKDPSGQGVTDMHWTAQGLLVDSNFTVYLLVPGRRPRDVIPGRYGGLTFAVGGTRVATGLERAPGPYVVTDVVSGKRWKVGSATAVNNYGAVAPDGSRVAWSGPGGVWIDRLGQPWHRLAAAAACPSWSPDGESISFMRFADLRVISASGGRSRLLAAKVGGCQQTAWSPDSSTIGYTGPRGVILVDAHTGHVTRVQKALGDTFYPAWSSDGSALYVSSRPPRDKGFDCLDVARIERATGRFAVVVRGCP